MKGIREMRMAELAAYLATQLNQRNIDVVLSGGACVSIYSDNRYVSADIDLVNAGLVRRRIIREAMRELGFQEERRSFTHPDTAFLIEFPAGPLSIGEEPVKQLAEMRFDTGSLRLLSPTDCVKDRLAGYYHWQDLQSLEQAMMVALSHRVDLAEIERWSKLEGYAEKFKEILRRFVKSGDIPPADRSV
jgi:hypothetical protein